MSPQMSLPSVSEILDYLAPYIVCAGDYAATIQGRVASQPSKDTQENAFGQALTDADLSVQAFIEVSLLARYPQLKFFGEEYASSLNMKYFNIDSELCVYLDPVDGTLYYRDNLDKFNVIVSICNREEILGALCYIPRYNQFFRAEKGKGARSFTRDKVLQAAAGTPLKLNIDGRVAVTFAFPEAESQLKDEFRIIDVAREYTPEKGCINVNGLLLGECSAVIFKKAGLIDWGAMAFIATEAGAVASQLDGGPLPSIDKLHDLTYPPIVVGSSAEIHGKIIRKLHS